MMAMQTHLGTMTAHELREFKRRITPNTTQIFVTTLTNEKTPTNPLSRETSPHTNHTLTTPLPSRETGPHPTKSLKKLTQALKKRAKYETERQIQGPHPNRSHKTLAQALKSTTKAPHPNPSMK